MYLLTLNIELKICPNAFLKNHDYKSFHLMTSLENYIQIKGNYFQNVLLHNIYVMVWDSSRLLPNSMQVKVSS